MNKIIDLRGKKFKLIKSGIVLFFIAIVARYFAIPNLLYPTKYKEIVLRISEKYSLEPSLVFGVIKTESKFNSEAVSKKGARGLMQIMPATGEWIAEKYEYNGFSEDMLFNPETNIELGCVYLKYLVERYDNNLETALAAYNGGMGNVTNWLREKKYSNDGKTLFDIPFPETKNYVKKVVSAKKMYERLYGDFR